MLLATSGECTRDIPQFFMGDSMKIHFLGSTIEKQKKDMRNQFDKLEAYATRIAKGEKPFDITEYKMNWRWSHFIMYRLGKTHSIKPYLLFFGDCLKNIFTKTATHTPNHNSADVEEESNRRTTVTVGATGLIHFKGAEYWSITSAVLRNQTVEVINPDCYHPEIIGRLVSIFKDGELIGSADIVNKQS